MKSQSCWRAGNRQRTRILRLLMAAVATTIASGCISTSMQGYADHELPAKPIQHVSTLVTASKPLASSIRASVINEAANTV
jgi:hypothetical protein